MALNTSFLGYNLAVYRNRQQTALSIERVGVIVCKFALSDSVMQVLGRLRHSHVRD